MNCLIDLRLRRAAAPLIEIEDRDSQGEWLDCAMCHQTTCKLCKKATWAGCGQHKDDVMRGVPKNQRCVCTPEQKEAARKQSFFGRLFG